MSRRDVRARRGQVGLVLLSSKCWAIRWGRRLARSAGLPLRESTGTRDRKEATAVLEQRRIEVYRSLGRDDLADKARRHVEAIGIADLIAAFLRDYAAGKLPGRKPCKGTVGLYVTHALGKRGGLLAFAKTARAVTTTDLSAVLVTRWLEAESRRVADDTIRMKTIVAKRLAAYAFDHGLVPRETHDAIRALHPPRSARGRARVDGVPGETEVRALLEMMKPRRERAAPYHLVAELQMRLGLRRGEVFALRADWLDEKAGEVRVTVSTDFDTKSHASRKIDGVDPGTFALARDVLDLRKHFAMTASGYREAWKRACDRLERSGHPWRYRNKSHALRSVYASLSRIAGVPLSVVRDRLGHSSESVTERHYVGRINEPTPGPFAGKPTYATALRPHQTNVLPFPTPRAANE